MIAEISALAAYLAEVQSARAVDIRCELTPALSTQASDATLVEALITGLPMAQGIQHRIVRSRGRGALLTAKLRYRDAVRMLDSTLLTEQDQAALACARHISAEAMLLADAEERFRHIFDWVCSYIHYVHTAPGQKGYEQLVGASGALVTRQANCQGFADVVYLLCGLCDIPCRYCIARGERRLHVWNSVCIDGVWRDADASKGARKAQENGEH